MDKTSRLKDLAGLRDSGALTESEFEREKRNILNSDDMPAMAPYPPAMAPYPPAMAPPPYGAGQPMMSPPLGGGTRILFYILSFLIPIAGFIVGAIYLSNNNPENQGVGKNCLIIAILTIVVLCLCYFFGMMAFMDSMSGGTFQCGSGEWIDASWVNDGMCDCYDCSDE